MSLFIFALYYLANLSLWTYWTTHPVLSQYNLQALGVIVILYIVSKKVFRGVTHEKLSLYGYITLFSAISLLILSTGRLESPFFFLFNFLLLSVALIFGYKQAFLGSLISIIFFSWLAYPHFNPQSISHLFSLVLIAPFSYLISNYYISALESRGTIKRLSQTLRIEEQDSLLFVTQQTKPTLAHVVKTINDLLMFLQTTPTTLPTGFVSKLSAIETDLLTIYRGANELENELQSSKTSQSDSDSENDKNNLQ